MGALDQKSRLALIVVTAVVVAGVAVWWFVAGPFGGSAASRMAKVFPDETTFLAWSGSVEELLAVGRDAGFDGEALATENGRYGEVVEKLGANPLTIEGLKTLGIDPSGSLGFALIPSKEATMLAAVHIPVSGSAIDSLKELLKKVEFPGNLILEEVDSNGHRLAFLGNNSKERIEAALLEVDGGAVVLFAVNHKISRTPEIVTEIKAFADSITSKKERLSSVDSFDETVHWSNDSLAGLFFHPGPDTRQLEFKDDGAQFFFWIMASAVGVGAELALENKSLVLRSNTLFSGADSIAFGERDVSVLEDLPGNLTMGFHVKLDLEKLQRELNSSIPDGAKEHHQIYKLLSGVGPEIGLPEGKNLRDLLSGELGFFAGAIEPDLFRSLEGMVVFAGLNDSPMAEEVLLKLSKGLLRDPEKEVLGDGTLYTYKAGLDTPVGMWITPSRVWVAGDTRILRQMAEKKGEFGDSKRAKEIAGGLFDDDNVGAGFIDIQAIVEDLSATIPKRPEGLKALLEAFDFLSIKMSLDDSVGHSEVSLVAKGENFRKDVLPILGTLLADGFGIQKKSVETKGGPGWLPGSGAAAKTEAIDTLDKIAKGAAEYYSTPMVEQYTGKRIECQFPATVDRTPYGTCCGSLGGPDQDGDGRCDSTPDDWNASTWNALRFQIMEPHYCVYSFESNGKTLAEAEFTATALCDMDCDGKLATFQRYGRGTASPGFECQAELGGGIFVNNEDE